MLQSQCQASSVGDRILLGRTLLHLVGKEELSDAARS